MHPIDWIVIAVPLAGVFGIALFSQRYMRSVSHFMAGGRVAGRYLLAVSRGEMAAGAVVFAATFEMIDRAGFSYMWWNWINVPVVLLVATTGFVVYRYRETRAMTLAQYFEIRYSKNFRVFAGFLGFIAGLLNFGIIPVIGARFIVTFLGLPPVMDIGGLVVGTHVIAMGVLLSFTLFLTLSGGQITVMLTDCLEGIISQILYLVIIGSLICTFSWTEVSQVMADRPSGQSLLNPFDSMQIKDFNLWFVLMAIFINVYGTMAWQNQSAYNAAGLTPHENRMGNILGHWREMGKQALTYLLAVCAMTYLLHPDFVAQSGKVMQDLVQIPGAHAQEQMRLPMAVSHLLPIGIKGAFCVILIMGIFGGDSTHLHSWGSLFVQDVLVPLRKRPFGAKQHIRALRLSIFGVALFVFVFGALFPQTEFIVMWWSVTTAIFVGGAGSVIIGGLYWKKGTTSGAWAAILSGSVLSVGGIIARTVFRDTFPLNGQQVSFFSSLIAIAAYVLVSLFTCQKDYDMDRMLHRGRYAKLTKAVGDQVEATPYRSQGWLARLVGIDEHFSVGDKLISSSLLGWGLLWFGVFLVGTIWNLISPWSIEVWKIFWGVVGLGIPIIMSLVTVVWFTWGGLRDIFDLFRRLKGASVNDFDDGTVAGHQNLDELMIEVSGEVIPEVVKMAEEKSVHLHLPEK